MAKGDILPVLMGGDKGIPHGVPSLDGGGKIPLDQLPPVVMGKNLFRNGYLIDPVNQRGQMSYQGNTFSIDCWKMENLNGFGTVDLVAGKGIVLRHQANGGFINFVQNTEFTEHQLVTCSVVIDGVLYQHTGLNDGTWYIPLVDGITLYSINPGVFFLRGSNENTHYIQAIKLELGTTQTLAHLENGVWVLNEIPDQLRELLKCQRYYQLFSSPDLIPKKAVDFRPPLYDGKGFTTGSIVVGGETLYYADAQL